MNQEYTYPKLKFQKEAITSLNLFFDNGDYLPISGEELAEISVNLYDKLICNGESFSPVAESGFLKFKLKENVKNIDSAFLYNLKEYKKSRKSYIENRCVHEGGLRCVQLFDENNWHYTIFANTVAEINGEFLIISFMPQVNFGSSNGEDHFIKLNDIKKAIIDSIELEFENCDGFTVYQNEISEINLDFEKELVWGSGDLLREVRGGYIKLKLDEEIYNRYINAWFADKRGKTVKQLENRICGKKGGNTHDICHLYINYNYSGFGGTHTECVEIEDVRPDEEIERLEALEAAGKGDLDFIGGFSKRLEDGTILITFGKNAEKLLNKQKES